MTQYLSSILAILLLSACAGNPIQEYSTYLTAPAEGEPLTASDAIHQVPGTKLAKGERAKFEIDLNDPQINLDGVRSFYQVFQVNGSANSSVAIKTFSHMKTGPAGGLGPIYVVWPRVYILDESGNVLSDKPESGEVGRAALGLGPLQYEATWKATMPASGACNVLVTSDNRVLGEHVAREDATLTAGGVFVPWTYGLRAHSTGAMSIEWR